MSEDTPKTPINWQKAAGLEQEPKPKKLDNIARYFPTWSEIASGAFFILMGLSAWTGGGIGIRGAADADPVWISLKSLPEWMGVVLIWFGVDSIFLKSRGTPWIFRKVVAPVIEAILKATIGEERMARWEERLERWATSKDKEEQ
jgi:hypothetical protein